MDTIHAIVAWLEGKKTIIIAIAALIISYLVTTGFFSAALGTLFQTILSLLAGGAVAVGSTQSYKDSQQG